VLERRLAREKVLEFFANLPPRLVGLEACAAAHYWARELAELGHTVRLMPPQHVRPYVKTDKHDAADAEACCEAVRRPGMRFVPVEGEERQSLLMLHRGREQLLKQRTATIKALRAHPAEFGIVAARRRAGLRELLAVVADTEDRRLPPLAREPLQVLAEHLRARGAAGGARSPPGPGGPRRWRVRAPGGRARDRAGDRHRARGHDRRREDLRLRAAPGGVAGAGAAAALERRQGAAAGDQQAGRRLPAAPAHARRQGAGGGQPGREGGLWAWVGGLLGRRPCNVVVAAVANKLARVARALPSRGEGYRAAA
jgi:transposase